MLTDTHRFCAVKRKVHASVLTFCSNGRAGLSMTGKSRKMSVGMSWLSLSLCPRGIREIDKLLYFAQEGHKCEGGRLSLKKTLPRTIVPNFFVLWSLSEMVTCN